MELIGRWLFLKPVRHLLRAVLIERTGEAARFRPWWAVAPLCEPADAFPLNWATMIDSPARRLWFWDDDGMPADFARAIERRVLPQLRAIETLDDFVAFADSPERFSLTSFRWYHLRSVGVDAARGDLESARKTCAELASGLTKWSMPLMRDEFTRVTETLCPLVVSGDRAAIAALLHRWEAYTVEKLKIGHIYEPTPFPLETGVHTAGS